MKLNTASQWYFLYIIYSYADPTLGPVDIRETQLDHSSSSPILQIYGEDYNTLFIIFSEI